MVKILLVHNFYGSSAPSGENTVYLAERDLLLGAGHQVSEFLRHSDEIRNRGVIGTLQGAFSTPWNPFSVRDVDAFISFTGFQRDKMIGAGLPAERIHIKPHFYADPPSPLPWKEREPKVIFIGRLGAEKGVHVLIEAWEKWGKVAPCLEIIGDGPERAALEKSAGQAGIMDKIHFLGRLPFTEVQEKLARARLLVLPSLCFEGFPMAIREAFALGVPVAASRLGSMAEIVTDGENGILFAPGKSEDLCGVVKNIWDAPEKLSVMATAARREYERKYTPEKNHELLIKIYQAAKINRDRYRIIPVGRKSRYNSLFSEKRK